MAKIFLTWFLICNIYFKVIYWVMLVCNYNFYNSIFILLTVELRCKKMQQNSLMLFSDGNKYCKTHLLDSSEMYIENFYNTKIKSTISKK